MTILIGLRVFIHFNKERKNIWYKTKIGRCQPDKRKNVKGKVWLTLSDLPLKNGKMVTCFKTKRRFIMEGIPTNFILKYAT